MHNIAPKILTMSVSISTPYGMRDAAAHPAYFSSLR